MYNSHISHVIIYLKYYRILQHISPLGISQILTKMAPADFSQTIKETNTIKIINWAIKLIKLMDVTIEGHARVNYGLALRRFVREHRFTWAKRLQGQVELQKQV